MNAKLRRLRDVTSVAAFAAACGLTLAHAPASGAAGQQFAAGVTPLLDAANGKTIGSVNPAAVVNVRGTSGSMSHVTVNGFTAPGAPATVYAAPPDHHIVAVSGFSGHGAPGATQSVAGTAYTAVSVDGWVATNALVGDVATVLKSAADLYDQKCSNCHSLRPPNSYSASQWPAVMKTQADNAGLDPGQTALITVYLQIQSGK